jgi:hypothetical protein
MSLSSPVEVIESDGVALAYIIDPHWSPDATTFLTPGDISLQMGMIVYGAGQDIAAHVHLPITRQVEGTSECIIVRKGRCRVSIYDSQRKFIADRDLEQGAIILLLGGGHGFHLYEDTVLFEVKQGPYAGNKDKERF